jgi:orotidine-5'-phosphate decarboxylase
MANFHQRLQHSWRHSDSLLCVGIDPDGNRLPKHLLDYDKPFLEFGKAIVDATAAHVCAFKPQAAHFAAVGREEELADLIAYIKAQYPETLVILDAKRGDVGSTAKLYAQEAFQRYNADAVTVSPYLGKDSLEPYLEYAERGTIVLCRTSNPGSDWLQNETGKTVPTYLKVAQQVREWDTDGQCMLVTGATYPDELARVRQVVGDMPFAGTWNWRSGWQRSRGAALRSRPTRRGSSDFKLTRDNFCRLQSRFCTSSIEGCTRCERSD